MPQKNTAGQGDALTRTVRKQELQERWKHLELKPATLLHLQELLDTRGITAAVLVTDVLAREKRPKVTEVGMEWSFEELRLISLEGIRPHLVDLIRVVLEFFMAWRFLHLPGGALDGLIELVLATLFFVIGVGVVCFTCRFRRKESPLMTPFEGVLHSLRKKKRSIPLFTASSR